eukprot:3158758-Amphidinium_carterae.2
MHNKCLRCGSEEHLVKACTRATKKKDARALQADEASEDPEQDDSEQEDEEGETQDEQDADEDQENADEAELTTMNSSL